LQDDGEEACEECKESAGVLVTDEICHTLQEKSNINCRELVQKVLDKEISAEEYVDTIIDHAEKIGHHEDATILRDIKRLMYE
jgi:hypothetical protein